MLGPQHLLPGDFVDVIDKGPSEDAPDFDWWAKQNDGQPVRHRWHAVDAKHAIATEPERYELVEYPVAVDPHAPGYSAVTPGMAVRGFNAPLREQPAVEPEPEPEPEPEFNPPLRLKRKRRDSDDGK